MQGTWVQSLVQEDSGVPREPLSGYATAAGLTLQSVLCHLSYDKRRPCHTSSPCLLQVGKPARSSRPQSTQPKINLIKERSMCGLPKGFLIYYSCCGCIQLLIPWRGRELVRRGKIIRKKGELNVFKRMKSSKILHPLTFYYFVSAS